jgi:hypothetical protein
MNEAFAAVAIEFPAVTVTSACPAVGPCLI